MTQPHDGPAPEPVDLLADAVLMVPGVHDLHGGVLGEVATYLPGRRVPGIRLREQSGGVDVHVVLDWDAPVAATSEQVRVAVRALQAFVPAVRLDGPIDVVVEDYAPPGSA